MRIAMFYHSLISCWNHGNAHFLRGVATELVARGHELRVFEPRDGWSARNMLAEPSGRDALAGFRAAYPTLSSEPYDEDALDLDRALDGVELVLVHEWTSPWLVARIGAHRARCRSYRLLFHDTHHRSATAPVEMAAYDLRDYDGVLAFGAVVRQLYLDRGWTGAAWTWHEAADVRRFRPLTPEEPRGELVWIGNWGDDERGAELHEFLLRPIAALGLSARVYGVRYPDHAQAAVRGAGASYGGWLPNHEVPEVFARHRVTVHVPRRPYVRALPGIPTIRPFEALACGIPLVTSPWRDSERLFEPGRDYLVARDGDEMRAHLRAVLHDADLACALARNGRSRILSRHTCAHRVDELLVIARELGADARPPARGTA